MDRKRIRTRIIGRVQGVFFRAHTREKAQQLGLQGWVRNCPDGSVEALFEGKAASVDEMLAWCRQGPPLSHVMGVQVDEEEPTGIGGGFTVRYY